MVRIEKNPSIYNSNRLQQSYINNNISHHAPVRAKRLKD